MGIQLYLLVPDVEFFTWLAVYMQFNFLTILILFGGTCEHLTTLDTVKVVMFNGCFILPALLYLLVTDKKGFNKYFYERYIERPK